MTPKVMPPGPLMRMVRGMCARTVSNMMDDLQKEIERRRLEEAGEGAAAAGAKHGAGGKGAAAAAAGPRGQRQPHQQLACLSARALDLFAGSQPLQITIEL